MNNAYLIDTHVLLWWLSDDGQLIQKTKNLIEDPDNSIIVSAASIWEIAIKKSLNKLKAPDNLKDVLKANNVTFLPISVDHALYVECLPNIHYDPFDRLLIAQCNLENLTLITTDKTIIKYKIKCK